jgi:hypothetical protein
VPLLVSIGDNFFANFAKECTQNFQGSFELQQAMKASACTSVMDWETVVNLAQAVED